MNILSFDWQLSSYNKIRYLKKNVIFLSLWYPHTRRWLSMNSCLKRFLKAIVFIRFSIIESYLISECATSEDTSCKRFIIRAIRARNVADRREIKPAYSVNCCSARNEFPVQFIRACRNRLPRSLSSEPQWSPNFPVRFQRDVFMRHFCTNTPSASTITNTCLRK